MDSFSLASVPQQFEVLKGGLLICALVAIEAMSFFVGFWRQSERYPWLNGMFIVLCLLAISLLGTFKGNTFIYAQF